MKIHLYCCVLALSILPIVAGTAQLTPVAVSIDVPNPSWSLKIVSIHTKANKLLIVCNAQKKEGMAPSVMSKAGDSAQIPSELAKLPREIFVTGQQWNYSEGYKALTAEQLEIVLTDATEVYSASKPIQESSFIGLAVNDAMALAKKNNFPSRVVEIDGKPQPATMDFRPERFNFATKAGKVIRVTKG